MNKYECVSILVVEFQTNKVLDKRGYLMIIEDDFSHFSLKPLCCDPSSEPSRDGSDEGSQHMFLCRINR